MGIAKRDLPFGDETMLARVARRLAAVADPIVVVGGFGHMPPQLATTFRFASDAIADRGPLEGLAAGLQVVADDADAIYATTCDAPLVVPAFVRLLADSLGECDAAVPWDGEFLHPLSAVYRVRILPTIERMLAADQLRPKDLANEVSTARVSVDELRSVDAKLDSLRNLNRPAEYLAALAAVGSTPPPELLDVLRRRVESF
jgi:molybdopterin-guanine dinucleotide biosynthesis protein A